ncbi:MAG: methyltransferase [Pseudomonadota bacterium]
MVERDGDVTLDGFLDNQIALYQPAKGAHRSGLDALLLAATVPDGFKGHVVDLGAGCGAAGLSALVRAKGATVSLLEKDERALSLLKRSLQLDCNAGVSRRARVQPFDVFCAPSKRLAAGLPDSCSDWLITNPPYNSAAFAPSPFQEKAAAHGLHADGLVEWFRVAIAMLRHGGHLTAILRPDNLVNLLPLMEGRAGDLRILPLHPKAGEAATRILFGARRGKRAGLTILPGLDLHLASGEFCQTVEDALRGRTALSLW